MSSQRGFEEADYGLATLYLEKKENLKAAKEYAEKVSKRGDVRGTNFLGIIYSNQGDTKNAEKYWKKAADAGDLGGMYNLADYYYKTNNTKLGDKYLEMMEKKMNMEKQ